MPAQRSKATGQFLRQLPLWTPAVWNQGYADNNGRFRVYRPDYPRAYAEGYALRAHVVYWLANHKVHPKGTVLHHLNEVPTDDRLENLQVLPHGEHSRRHHTRPKVSHPCAWCGKPLRANCPSNLKLHCSQSCGVKAAWKRGKFKEAITRRWQRTHCKRGHEYVDGSFRLRTQSDGSHTRRCLLCAEEDARKRYGPRTRARRRRLSQ